MEFINSNEYLSSKNFFCLVSVVANWFFGVIKVQQESFIFSLMSTYSNLTNVKIKKKTATSNSI